MKLRVALDPTGPTVWARIASLFVDYGVRRGASRSTLLAAGGLSDRSLADPDGRVPLTSLYTVVEAIEALTGDRNFGLELVLGLEIEALDALGFLFMTSATFGSALDRMLRYQRLWNEGERCELVSDGAVARLTYEPYGLTRPAHVQMAQAAMCDCVVNGARFLPGLEFEEVRFRHARPDDASAYERVLGVPVRFGCATTEARFSAQMLALPIPDANATLCAFFERYATAKLERLPAVTTTAERLRAAIRGQLPDGDVRLADLAEQLHMSARTLQRRLSDEGTSLQAELDEVRRQQALYFLEGGTAIAELSWLLGYAEPSAFHRAFKRWTGTSPEAWRAERRSA
ncbi:MAG TPA: AraC family transcriptional regulator [Polyangiaceae bacterium]|nr:AraC family transcriptional regulator [Polyangiaceae bacterium]